MKITNIRFYVHPRQGETLHSRLGPYFATRKEAQQYIDDNKLDDVWIGRKFSATVDGR